VVILKKNHRLHQQRKQKNIREKLSEKLSEDVYAIKNSKVTQDDVIRLKSHGFLTGGTEEVKFTGKAKAVITTMVLGESNAFQKEQKNVIFYGIQNSGF
jgi:hypothetical protein